MLLRNHHHLFLASAFQSIHHLYVPTVLAFNRALIIASKGNIHPNPKSTTASNNSSIIRKMSSDTQEDTRQHQQLFGRFQISHNQIFHKTALSFALVNLRPLVPGHVLICSKRITPLLLDLEDDEYDDIWRTVRTVQKVLKKQYNCDAFNVAVQDGEGAGQTVPHVHVHILPRFKGDLKRNDEIYDRLEKWAPRDDVMSIVKPTLNVPDDIERRDRTEAEMEEEAATYRSLMDDIVSR